MHEMIGRFDVLSTSAAPSLRGASRLWTKPFLNVNPFRYRVAPEGLFFDLSELEPGRADSSKGSDAAPAGSAKPSSKRSR